jgi:hypothetical protein
MKDLEQQPTPIEIREVEEQRKDFVLIGQLVSKPGLILWEFDPVTKILKEAEIKENQLQIDKSSKGHFFQSRGDKDKLYFNENVSHEATVYKRVNYRKGCVYFQAINEKNARRKLDAMLKA